MKKGKTKKSRWSADRVQPLAELYNEKHLTLGQVGDEFGISSWLVYYLFKKFGVPIIRRYKSQKLKDEQFIRRHLLAKKILIDLYIDKKVEIADIIRILKTNRTVLYKSLKIHAIPKRGRKINRRQSPLTYDLLYKMYIEENLTAGEIAERLEYKPNTIRSRLARLGIKR